MSAERRFTTAYGLAHGGKSLFWNASELLFAYFLTEACDLPPRKMGIILGVSLLLSAVFDLLVGWRLGGRVSTVADAGRMQWLGAVGSGLSFALFGLAGLVPAESRFAYALVTIIVFRFAYAFLDNPQNAILALGTSDDRARVRLATVRYIYGGIAGMLVAAAFTPLLKDRTAIMDAGSFAVFAALVALVGLGTALQLRRTLDQYAVSPSTDPVTAIQPRPRRWPIFAMIFLMAAATSVFGRLEPYFVSYNLVPRRQGGLLLVCLAGGSVLSQPLWHRVALRYSLSASLRISATSLLGGSVAFGAFAPTSIAIAAISGFVYGAGSGGLLMSLWALAAASAKGTAGAYGATRTFGKLTFAAKLALGLSALGTGEFLATAGYRTAGDGSILALMTGAAVVGAFGCLLLSRFLWLRRVGSYR